MVSVARRRSVAGTHDRRGRVEPVRAGTYRIRERAQNEQSRSQMAAIQRARLLAGAVRAVDELGYTSATVAHITARASVSRRTFYELFADREECFAAVLDDVASQLRAELAAAGLRDLSWRERVRGGLLTILAFFDREPALARVCLIQALRGGSLVRSRREQLVAQLEAVVDEGREIASRGSGCSPLTAEGVVGGALAIVYARLQRATPTPLTGLANELMGILALPYLGAAAARREQTRPVPSLAASEAVPPDARGARDPLEGVAMRMTYRTARVLEGVAARPGASNRELAERAGIVDQGQISKLLARLERLELVINTGAGHAKGEPNSWRLTAKGERIALTVYAHRDHQSKPQ